MIFPDEWIQKLQSDLETLDTLVDKRALSERRSLRRIKGIRIFKKNPLKNEPVEVDPGSILLTGLNSTTVGMKILFQRPDLISLSS